MCGKNSSCSSPRRNLSGSPPRVREKRISKTSFYSMDGITPACAGKTTLLLLAVFIAWDHPRVCGKNFYPFGRCSETLGSPPRVREKLAQKIKVTKLTRITPACAGKTIESNLRLRLHWDHPRVCGKNCMRWS